MHRTTDLPVDYALVLQQINHAGGEDFNNLAETLEIDRNRLSHIVRSLQHKGLVMLRGSGQRGFWVQLSSKGRKLLTLGWPAQSGWQPSY